MFECRSHSWVFVRKAIPAHGLAAFLQASLHSRSEPAVTVVLAKASPVVSVQQPLPRRVQRAAGAGTGGGVGIGGIVGGSTVGGGGVGGGMVGDVGGGGVGDVGGGGVGGGMVGEAGGGVVGDVCTGGAVGSTLSPLRSNT